MNHTDSSTTPGTPAAVPDILGGAFARYQDALSGAAGPLGERLQAAYRHLVEGQLQVQAEISGRVAASCQEFSVRMATIVGASSRLGPAIDAYCRYAEALGAYADFSRLADVVGKLQTALNAALVGAAGQPDPEKRAADAIGAYCDSVNRLLADDPLRAGLESALAAYVERLRALQEDILKASQDAVDALTAALGQALTEAREGTRSRALIEGYAGEINAIGGALAEAYETAVAQASEHIRSSLAQAGIPVADTVAAPVAAPIAALSAVAPAMAAPFAPEAPVAAEVAQPAAEAAAPMPAAEGLPRAAWVDVPAPPTRAWQAPAAAKETDDPAPPEDGEPGANRPRTTRPPSRRPGK